MKKFWLVAACLALTALALPSFANNATCPLPTNTNDAALTAEPAALDLDELFAKPQDKVQICTFECEEGNSKQVWGKGATCALAETDAHNQLNTYAAGVCGGAAKVCNKVITWIAPCYNGYGGKVADKQMTFGCIVKVCEEITP